MRPTSCEHRWLRFRLRLENLEPDVTDPGKEDLSGALREVERLSALVDGLLTLARADRAHSAPSPISLGPLVEKRVEAWSALAAESDVGLRLELESDVAAFATPGRVEQVLDNLLANAIDASPGGATITVATCTANGWAELHVADEGPGLSETERSRAFDRFWQAHEGGTDSAWGWRSFDDSRPRTEEMSSSEPGAPAASKPLSGYIGAERRGYFAATFAAQRSRFDLPEVAVEARAHVEPAGSSDRCRVTPGSFCDTRRLLRRGASRR